MFLPLFNNNNNNNNTTTYKFVCWLVCLLLNEILEGAGLGQNNCQLYTGMIGSISVNFFTVFNMTK